MLLSELVSIFTGSERLASNMLDDASVLAQAVAATRLYAGYAHLVAHEGAVPEPEIDGHTDVTVSEWAIIRPLFLLYVERETAVQLEATRIMGADVFGRPSGEVASEIAQVEAELPHKAFYMPIVTV